MSNTKNIKSNVTPKNYDGTKLQQIGRPNLIFKNFNNNTFHHFVNPSEY